MMGGDILQTAASLKHSIAEEPSGGAKSLIDFSKKYAVKNKLRHDALILKLNLTKATKEEDKIQVKNDMLGLVDTIIRDFQENGQTEKAIKARVQLKKMEDYFASQEAANDIIFKCEGLGKTYKKTGFSLSDVNIELRLGEITSVVGENGNGKTTFFNLVVGAMAHDSGNLSFPYLKEGVERRIHWHKVKQHIAYVPQELPSWDGSLEQMLEFEAAIHGVKGDDNIREVKYIVQRLGLEEHLSKNWNQLSGGFKLRFSLAKALIWKPKLLVIDEPLANLDIKTQLLILKDIRNMANSFRFPMSVLMSSQHLHEIEAVSDKILFLEKGNVSFNGNLEDLGTAREHNTYEIGCNISLADLKNKLSGFAYQKLYHNGIAFVLTTSLDTDHKQVLKILMDRNIDIDYFRNISQSIKQLFEL